MLITNETIAITMMSVKSVGNNWNGGNSGYGNLNLCYQEFILKRSLEILLDALYPEKKIRLI